MTSSIVATQQPGLLGKLLTQAFALLVCFGVPALVTAIAPVSWVSFQRSGDGERVVARAQTCLLFVIPFKTVTVDPVTGLGDRTIAGTVKVERRSGTDKRTQSEDQGFLVIRGPDQVAKEVPV